MLIEVKVPMLAESVADAALIAWHKKPGDIVKRGDSLIDIETDKVTLEVAAPNDGVITEILKQDGEDVLSDEVIARIDTDVDARVESSPSIAPAEEETAKASPETAPEQQSLPVLDEAQVVNDDTWQGKAEESPEISNEAEKQQDSTKLSPAVRNLIDKHNLNVDDIEQKPGTDRITKEDVLNHIGELDQAEPVEEVIVEEPVSAPVAETKPTPAPVETAPKVAPIEVKKTTAVPTQEKTAEQSDKDTRPEQRVNMTRLRQRIAERLLNAQKENAILTTFNEVNMRPVMDLRARYKEEFEQKHGVKLGFMSFFCKATVEALKKFPVINASVDGKEIVYREYYDLGIAVSSPRGLFVPIVRDADLLSLSEIELMIREYGEKAQEGKLEIEDLTGGTFTITNGGVFGSLLSTPILNPPQSAILGMHKIQQRPVAEDGEVVIRPMMYLALSYDHRIIDGREAVQFLVTIKEQLEDPARLLLQI